jgi:hypothetical protein
MVIENAKVGGLSQSDRCDGWLILTLVSTYALLQIYIPITRLRVVRINENGLSEANAEYRSRKNKERQRRSELLSDD